MNCFSFCVQIILLFEQISFKYGIHFFTGTEPSVYVINDLWNLMGIIIYIFILLNDVSGLDSVIDLTQNFLLD